MNAKELATLLNVHPNTIYNMIKNGEIRAVKESKAFIIPIEEVERLLGEESISVKDAIQGIEIALTYLEKVIAELEENEQSAQFEHIEKITLYFNLIKHLEHVKKMLNKS